MPSGGTAAAVSTELPSGGVQPTTGIPQRPGGGPSAADTELPSGGTAAAVSTELPPGGVQPTAGIPQRPGGVPSAADTELPSGGTTAAVSTELPSGGMPAGEQNLYFLCSAAPPGQSNCITYPDPAQTLALCQAIQQLLEPERRLEAQLASLDRTCLSGTLQQLTDDAARLLGNPVMVLDRSFRPVCFSPARKLGIAIWDSLVEHGYLPQEYLQQVMRDVSSYAARHITEPQFTSYSEPDGRRVRQLVCSVVVPETRQVCGGVEIVELDRPFAPQDYPLVQRLSQVLLHHLYKLNPEDYPVSREEQLLADLLYSTPEQYALLERQLAGLPRLSMQGEYYAAAIPLSPAQLITSHQIRASLAAAYPGGWSLLTGQQLLLLVRLGERFATGPALQQALTATGRQLNSTIILSMRFPSLAYLPGVWQFNRKALDTALYLHLPPGCHRVAELHSKTFFHVVSAQVDLKPLIHPSILLLADYDRAHGTSLLPTLNVFLQNGCSWNATAAELYLHRNTLTYRIQRAKELIGLPLEDRYEREVIRLSCQIWDYCFGSVK